MLTSLYLYAKYFSSAILTGKGKYLAYDLYRYYLKNNRYYSGIHPDEKKRKLATARAVQWMLTAQKTSSDDGMGSYHLVNRWSSSYPETSGYIIPTLLQYASSRNDDNIQ